MSEIRREIRERHEAAERGEESAVAGAHHDRGTLLAEIQRCEDERKAWARLVHAERDATIEDESGVGDDGKSERELRAAKQALRDLGVNVDALLA